MAFTDLMLSYRGPGVVGTIMALFVVMGFSILFMYAFDEGEYGGNWTIERVIAQQTDEIADWKDARERRLNDLEHGKLRVSQEKELIRLKRESVWQIEKITSLGKAADVLGKEVSALDRIFGAYKDRYRTHIRRMAKGESMEKLKTTSGDIYENVSIRGVTPVGCEIRHEGGFKRIPFEELPDEMKIRFQFDPEQKEKALASEVAAQAELEAAVAASDKLLEQQVQQRRDEEASARRKSVTRTIEFKEARIRSLNEEIGSISRAIPDEYRKTVSRAGVMRAEIASKQREIGVLTTQIAALRRLLSPEDS